MTDDETQVGFLTPLRVENIDATTWVLTDRLIWRGSEGDVFVVDAGEETDFATVPWWTQSLLPRTGTWTKAAVLHDKMCNELNRRRREQERWRENMDAAGTTEFDPDFYLNYPTPVFNSVDTDFVFRKNARMEGTDAIRSELLWLGVRYGALANRARWEGNLSTLPRVALDTVLLLFVILLVVTLVSVVWPW